MNVLRAIWLWNYFVGNNAECILEKLIIVAQYTWWVVVHRTSYIDHKTENVEIYICEYKCGMNILLWKLLFMCLCGKWWMASKKWMSSSPSRLSLENFFFLKKTSSSLLFGHKLWFDQHFPLKALFHSTIHIQTT